MRARPLFFVAASIAAIAPVALADDASESSDDEAVEAASRAALARLAPGVVEVETLGGIPERHDVPDPEKGEAPGNGGKGVLVKEGFKQAFGPSTGIVVRKDGLILTSTFVLAREPTHVFVTLDDGRSLVAKPLGRDESRMIALLRVDATLAVPEFAARDAAKVGRFTLAVGRGLGVARPSVSLGILSARDRIGGKALQSSAAISPVNYGGPLATIDGAVLGILVPLSPVGTMASTDFYDSGIGFAIPIADVLDVLPRLEAGERLEPGFLGVVIDPGSTSGGARVVSVADSSPASRAEIHGGDVIVALDGQKIDSHLELQRALGRHYAGDRVKLALERKGARIEVEVKLAKRAKERPTPAAPGPKPPGEEPR